jgi:hypothetical protein
MPHAVVKGVAAILLVLTWLARVEAVSNHSWFVGTHYKTLSVADDLGFELASERSVVGRDGPKIENAVALEIAATA